MGIRTIISMLDVTQLCLRKKQGRIYKKILLVLSFICVVNLAQGQTCNYVVGGTDFSVLPGSEANYYNDLNKISHQGPSGNVINSTGPTLAVNAAAFNGTQHVYGVVDNPRKFNSNFMDVEDDMLVIQWGNAGQNSPLFNYNVSDLEPGSNYSITVDMYLLPIASSPCGTTNQYQEAKIRAGVNAVPNDFTDYSIPNLSWGTGPHTITINGTLGATESSITLGFATGNSSNFPCVAIGFSNIEIKGCPLPRIKSSQGQEVCQGEQILFTLGKTYDATTYLWEKSLDNGGSWASIGTGKSVIEKIASDSLLEQRKTRRWGIFFKLLTLFYLSIILIFVITSGRSQVPSSGEFSALIKINGVIGTGLDVSAEDVISSLKDAYSYSGTKAIILEINSPGGSPVQSGMINDEIRRGQQMFPDIPVYAVVQDICASGG